MRNQMFVAGSVKVKRPMTLDEFGKIQDSDVWRRLTRKEKEETWRGYLEIWEDHHNHPSILK